MIEVVRMDDKIITPVEHLRVGKELLERLLKNSYINENVSMRREVNHNINRLNDKSFKIAVIGEFSSGKSTFLNAIIGKDYLTHGVEETTAAVTMLINASEDNRKYGIIKFNDGTSKSLDSYEQLKDVTSTHSSSYQVSHQIESVELRLPFMDTELPLVLVDTPGLNGVAAMHKERTIDIIQGVHACIYMLQSRGISETDKKTLQWVGHYQRELIIVRNFIDDISTSEGDTLDDILDKQRNILSENVFPDQEHINYTVCGVSAIKALASKDETITRLYNTDTVDLTDIDRQRLYQESNFEQAMNCINQFMQQAFMRSHLSTLYSTYNFLERTANIMTNQYDIINAIWENSDDAQVVLRIRQLLDNWESRQEENEKKLDNFVTSKMNECRRLTINELRRLIEEEQGKIPSIYEMIAEPEEWDSFIKAKKMETAVADVTIKIKTSIDDFLERFCENTHNLAILRIQEYSGLSDDFSEQSLPKYRTAIGDQGVSRFTQEENDIETEESGLQRLISQRNMADNQKTRLLEEEQRLRASFSQSQQERDRIENNYTNQKRRLGGKPEADVYYEKVTERVRRGGFFGGIADFFDGGKKTTRQEARYDYSAQRQWEKYQSQLQNEYSRQNNELNSQLRSLEQGIEETKQQINELITSSKADSVRIERKQAIIREKIESLKEKRLLAAKEYLQRQKDKLWINVCDYLSNTLQEAFSDNINTEILRIRKTLCGIVRELYIDVSRSQKNDLQRMLNKNRSSEGVQHESLSKDLNDVLEIKNILEVYLCKQQVQPF